MTSAPASVDALPNCQVALSDARAEARRNKGWTDRACAVLERGGDYYRLEDEHGELVWEGQAHCRWCARTQAIATIAKGAFILWVEGRETDAYAGPEAAMGPAIKAYDQGARIIRLRGPTALTYVFSADGQGAFAWVKPPRSAACTEGDTHAA